MALDQAGHDVYRRGVGACAVDHGQQGADACQVDGHVQVRRFLPALGAADHAAGDDGQRRFGAQPVAASLFKRQVEAGQGGAGRAILQGLRQAHDAPGQMPGVQRAARVVQPVRA
ncbi:hypothetical protein D3C86_1475250 [compost metagenome]